MELESRTFAPQEFFFEKLQTTAGPTLRSGKSREKQIETVLSNLAGIRGSLEGYVGQKLLPSMETLSLEAIETDENEAET